MGIIEQLKRTFGLQPAFGHGSEIIAMREALEVGRRAKRAEEYDAALDAFGRAAQIAQLIDDPSALAVIYLHEADVRIARREWAEAERLLTSVRETSENHAQHAQLGYTLSALGMSAQAQDDWTRARDYYEQARQIARDAHAQGAEGRALGHLADTYLHEGNASYAIHLLRESLPLLNNTGDIELSSYFVGLLGEALIASGQEVEGNQLLNRALRLAEQMRYREYERRWSLAIGERAAAEGRYMDAYARLKQGLRLYDSAAATPTFIRGLCRMSAVCLNLQQLDEALQYAQQAARKSDMLNGTNPAVEAQAQGALGIALHAAKRSTEAIPHLEAAATLQHDANGTSRIDILRTLAAAQVEGQDDTTAVATYQQALEAAKAMDAELEVAQTHRDLGHLYARRRQMQPAIQEWQLALAIYDAGKHYPQMARLQCDIAGARRFLGQGQRSIKDYEQALMALNSVDDAHTRGLVLSNAANAYVDQGDLDTAESFFSEALAIATQTGDTAAEATRRGNYGWFLLSTGKARQAITALERALQLSQMLNLNLNIAVQTDNLGLAYDTMADYPTALHYHQKALDLIRKQNNPYWEAVFKLNLAGTLLATNQAEQAAALYDEALAQGRADSSIELIVRAQTGRAKVALAQDEPRTAEEALAEAVTTAKRSDMRRLLAEALIVRSEQQAALDQPEQAAALWEEAQKLFTLLRSPQATLIPAWLHPVEP